MICALGDLLLDVIVRVDEPIAEDTDTYGRTHVGPGGQAANVAAWVAELGGRARFIGKRARDPAGRILREELARRDVDVAGPAVEAGTGTVVSLARSDGRRTMLTDRGTAPDLCAEEIEPAWFAGCDLLHVPGYSLVRSPIAEAALRAAAIARQAGARVSVDLSSTRAVRELGIARFRARLAELRPETVFGNEDELDLVGEVEADAVVRKRGALGCAVHGPDGNVSVFAAAPAEVVDTTGAGDALAAGFLLGGPDAGVAAAARCVARMGAFPP
ncbi:MAG TPA: carbohydrate kinase family protein [Gaiellaceae bacterium]|nr:carbohydrate kinase family protein [Gaiellaceae bacterium]